MGSLFFFCFMKYTYQEHFLAFAVSILIPIEEM